MQRISFLGQESIRASNGELAFTVVPGWGSNLVSLVHEPTGTELLRRPETASAFLSNPVLYGVPVLFPPNRIAGGTFRYRGREYRFDINEPERGNHIHGLVYTRPWKVVHAGVDEGGRPVVETRLDVTHCADREDILRQFPHPFVLSLRLTLDRSTLRKEIAVHNASGEPFPFGLGFHTTFLFPDDAHFALDVEKRWRLDHRLIPTGELEDIPFREELAGGMSLAGVTLDDAFLVAETARGSAATVTYPVGSARLSIRYEADENFRHWVVYNRDGRSGFICPEPYTWITNAPNLNLPPSLTGLQELQPGESKRLLTTISVSVA